MGAAWFVDGGYAREAWKDVRTAQRLDYALLRQEIERDAGEHVGDAYYFDCNNDPPSAGQNGFHRFLQSSPPRGPGLRVKLYWLQTKQLYWPKQMGGEPVLHPVTGETFITKSQKAVDVGLAFNLMRSFANKNWDKLYLFAGDGDFSDVVKYLVETEDVTVTIIGSHGSVSGELESYARIVDLSEIASSVSRENGVVT